MEINDKIQQHPERSRPRQYGKILAAARVAHVGLIIDGMVYIIPFSYHFSEEHPQSLYLHGAKSSRTLTALSKGVEICVEVSLLDGLVYSRSALNHSMNYRSVVAFGPTHRVDDLTEKNQILEAMIERYFPGRTAGRDYESATPKQLEITTLIRMDIQKVSAKIRSGPGKSARDKDPNAWGTHGIIPLREDA